jgi:hypothetical protein
LPIPAPVAQRYRSNCTSTLAVPQVSAAHRWVVPFFCRRASICEGHPQQCIQRLPYTGAHGHLTKLCENMNLCWAQTLANTIGLRFAIALAQARRRSLLIRRYGVCLAGECPLVRGTNHSWYQPFVRPSTPSGTWRRATTTLSTASPPMFRRNQFPGSPPSAITASACLLATFHAAHPISRPKSLTYRLLLECAYQWRFACGYAALIWRRVARQLDPPQACPKLY